MFVQGRDVTHFRSSSSPVSLWDGLWPAPGALPPPFPAPLATGTAPCSLLPGAGNGAELGPGREQSPWAPLPLPATGGCSLSRASLCWGVQRLRTPLRGSSLQTSTAEQSRGDGGFPDIVSAGSLGTEQVGFGTSSTNVYLHVHTMGRRLTSAEREQTGAVLLPGPASEGKTEPAAPTASAAEEPPARRALRLLPLPGARPPAACRAAGKRQGV